LLPFEVPEGDVERGDRVREEPVLVAPDGHRIDHLVVGRRRFESVAIQEKRTEKTVDDRSDHFRSSRRLRFPPGDGPIGRLESYEEHFESVRIEPPELVELVGTVREPFIVEVEVTVFPVPNNERLY